MTTNFSKPYYEFGPFRLHEKEMVVVKDGQARPLSLQSKTVETLLALVKRAGKFCTKDSLMEEIWADQFVEEGNLAKQVSKLREALGDQKPYKYIETYPKRGYKFVAPVSYVRDSRARAEERLTDQERAVLEVFKRSNYSHLNSGGIASITGMEVEEVGSILEALRVKRLVEWVDEDIGPRWYITGEGKKVLGGSGGGESG
jgi:DNA-binding winged helix-turn-helix (wHTH) protein